MYVQKKKKKEWQSKKRFILTRSKCYYVLAIVIFRTLKLCKTMCVVNNLLYIFSKLQKFCHAKKKIRFYLWSFRR